MVTTTPLPATPHPGPAPRPLATPHPAPPAARGGAALRLLAVLALTWLVGYALAHLPAPDDADELWAGNLAAPYLVVPALAGAWAWRRAGTAALAGGVAGAGLMLGFYDVLGAGRFALRPDAWLSMDLPRRTDALHRLAETYHHWTSNFVLGRPGSTPWLTIGVLTGLTAGLVGHAWIRSRGVVATVLTSALVAAPLLAEAALHVAAAAGGGRHVPLLGRVGYPLDAHNVALLGAEAAAGVVLFVALVVGRVLLVRIPPLSPFRTARRAW